MCVYVPDRLCIIMEITMGISECIYMHKYVRGFCPISACKRDNYPTSSTLSFFVTFHIALRKMKFIGVTVPIY